MDTINVNVKKSRIQSSRKHPEIVTGEKTETTMNIGDNLFSLMLITIAAAGIWAISAVLLL